MHLYKKQNIFFLFTCFFIIFSCVLINCTNNKNPTIEKELSDFKQPDTIKIPNDEFGEMVRYGKNLLLNTAYYIGPNGIAGHFTKNKMNCTNCHQEAGTKPFSFNLMMSHGRYPQYRPREGKVLTIADRVNNCVMRPHSGDPLPLDSKEMTAIVTYIKWIYSETDKNTEVKGYENVEIDFPDRAADSEKGALIYVSNCSRCHGDNGEGKMLPNNITYEYPPLWGQYGYQPGSSMHRIIKQARWLKSNMPHDLAKWYQPILTDEQCLDVAAFINNDKIHNRPNPKTFDYPNIAKKNIDYDKGPFIDTFSEQQHKYGPYKPIIAYWKAKGWKPVY
jgi:thiosulfate dehydrogenase